MKKKLLPILLGMILSLCSVMAQQRLKGTLFDGVGLRYTGFDYLSVYDKNVLNSSPRMGSGIELNIQKQLSGQVKLLFPFKFGQTNAINLNKKLAPSTQIMSMDMLLQVYFLKKQPIFRPFLRTGFATTTQNYSNLAVQLPFGVGFDIRLHPKLFLSFSSEYRFNGVRELDNLQHGVGLVFLFQEEKKDTANWKFFKKAPTYSDADYDGVPNEDDKCPYERGDMKLYGCPDKDGDGIPDKDDLCAETFGLTELKGCPDKDGDGVADPDDRCPDEAGKMDNFGCPIADDDDDGILDDDDDCPNAAGKIENKGCPDRDNDGIPDKDDVCPDEKGLATFFGCPDTDEDGVPDSEDDCKEVFGVAENKGCPIKKLEPVPAPIITDEAFSLIERANANLLFILNKSTLSAPAQQTLSEIATLLLQNPAYKLAIKGYTDNTGSRQSNFILSEKRAKTVYDYLIEQGVPSAQLSYKGYGASSLISKTNNDLNRRVELVLSITN